MTSPRRADVLVLGAGVIGLACAYELLSAGRKVILLDQRQPGAGASHGNCGTITPSHLPLNAPGTVAKALRWLLKPDAPFRVQPSLDPELLRWLLHFAGNCNATDFQRVATVKAQLLIASRKRLDALVAEAGLACEFDTGGTLDVYRTPAALAQAAVHIKLMRNLGIAVEEWDAAGLQRREPALLPDLAGAHFHPGDARLRPNVYVSELARAVQAAGGEIIEGTPISGLRVDGGRLTGIATPAGEFEARETVMALGAWSPAIGRQIGLKLPIQPGKGYSITFSRPRLAPAIPMVLKERGVCVTAWDSGYRLGSTMEFAGYDASLNRVRLDALKRGAAEYLREPLGPVVEEEWYGWRPMTWDDLPIIGRAPGVGGLTLATGHGMLGVTLSPITGRLVADLIVGGPPELDLAPFAAERFA